VVLTVSTEVLGDHGRAFYDSLTPLCLTIQETHGVTLETTLAAFAELIGMGSEVLHKLFSIGPSAFGTADAV